MIGKDQQGGHQPQDIQIKQPLLILRNASSERGKPLDATIHDLRKRESANYGYHPEDTILSLRIAQTIDTIDQRYRRDRNRLYIFSKRAYLLSRKPS
jgi:hypothetical protein